MSVWNLLLGKRLATDEEHAEQVGPLAGIPLLGLDFSGGLRLTHLAARS